MGSGREDEKSPRTIRAVERYIYEGIDVTNGETISTNARNEFKKNNILK